MSIFFVGLLSAAGVAVVALLLAALVEYIRYQSIGE